jgi:cold shock protein
VPTGKVKWYDAEKGFGFITTDDGADVFLRSDALPADHPSIRSGARVEFGLIQGRKGDAAIQVSLLEPPPSVARSRRKSADDMVTIVEDTLKLLEGVGQSYRRGRQPEARTARQTATLLRALADEMDLSS